MGCKGFLVEKEGEGENLTGIGVSVGRLGFLDCFPKHPPHLPHLFLSLHARSPIDISCFSLLPPPSPPSLLLSRQNASLQGKEGSLLHQTSRMG
jgi:hypothetical protein